MVTKSSKKTTSKVTSKTSVRIVKSVEALVVWTKAMIYKIFPVESWFDPRHSVAMSINPHVLIHLWD